MWLSKVAITRTGKGNSNSHGEKPVYQIISMVKRIRTRRWLIKNSRSDAPVPRQVSGVVMWLSTVFAPRLFAASVVAVLLVCDFGHVHAL